MKRQIIKIDEEKCNGCGLCVPNCPEGALQMIDGKARLVGELLCDGLGACIGKCPVGAITVEEREAEKYDENKVMDNVVKAGSNVIAAHLKHLRDHGQEDYLAQALAYLKKNNIPVPKEKKDMLSHAPQGCPGSMMRDFSKNPAPARAAEAPAGRIGSELRQWPTQLHLLNPKAPYFKDCDLAVVADCVPFAFGDFHRRFLKGKALVMFCPKLDEGMDIYLEKLTAIIRENNVRSVTAVRMEVPCCGGTVHLAEEAVKNSGKNVILKEYIISIRGEII